VRIGIAGSDSSFHNVVSSYAHLCHGHAPLLSTIDVRFYFIPLVRSEFSEWFGQADKWYGRTVVNALEAMLYLYPSTIPSLVAREARELELQKQALVRTHRHSQALSFANDCITDTHELCAVASEARGQVEQEIEGSRDLGAIGLATTRRPQRPDQRHAQTNPARGSSANAERDAHQAARPHDSSGIGHRVAAVHAER